jgi:hypothetical protein
MNIDFQSVARDIADARRRAEALIVGLSAEHLLHRPEPGKWSIAECIFRKA